MSKEVKKREGELTPEQSALAKKFFVAFGFLGIAILILALEYYVPIEYLLVGVLASGLLIVSWSTLRGHRKNALQQSV